MARPPVLGYNHNIKYKKILYHVQTEDSGLPGNHITTQVFHEGAIIASQRYDYSNDINGLDNEAQQNLIKIKMKDQHKGMVKSLLHGDLDEKIKAMLGEKFLQDEDEQKDNKNSSSSKNKSTKDVKKQDIKISSGQMEKPFIDVDKEINSSKNKEEAANRVLNKIDNHLSEAEEENDKERLPSSISSAFSSIEKQSLWKEKGVIDKTDIDNSVKLLAQMDVNQSSGNQEKDNKNNKLQDNTLIHIDKIIISYLKNVTKSKSIQ